MTHGWKLAHCLEVRADELLNAYNQDTRFNCSPKSFTEQLKKWCQYAEHINCYNPASCTGQKENGDRWQVREGDKRVNYYFIQTKAAAEARAYPDRLVRHHRGYSLLMLSVTQSRSHIAISILCHYYSDLYLRFQLYGNLFVTA